jgi:hypothetical protein
VANWIKSVKEENERLKAENEALKAQMNSPTPAAAVPGRAALGDRPPTKPWNRKDLTHRSFRRDYFNINKKAEWQERFVTAENVETLLTRGYEVAPAAEYKLVDKVIDDGKPLASHITRRGMVLMRKRREDYEDDQRLKEELLKQKRKSYKQQVREEAKKVQAEMGGDHRVIIDDDEEEK